MMKNNKGQILISFILLLPVLFMIFGLLVDCGYLFIEKRNVDNNVKDALRYGLDNLSLEENILESKIKKILNTNIENVEKINIKIENNIIEIEVNSIKKSIFTVIFSKYEYKISAHYRGYINDTETVIRKV